MGPLFWLIIAIIIISTVVGAVAKLLNNMNEMNNAPRNRPVARPNPAAGAGAGGGHAGGAGAGGGAVRQTTTDMDRFLAEIDRLRRKNADAPPPARGESAPVAPVVQPPKPVEKPRARVVAELAEPPANRPHDPGFVPPPLPQHSLPPLPPAPTGPKAGDLPMATVVAQPGGTGAPATKVTRLMLRPRPAPKTPFAKNLTTLLGTGQGLALAIVLSEVLGTPRSKKG
jgi:hypothetical protein